MVTFADPAGHRDDGLTFSDAYRIADTDDGKMAGVAFCRKCQATVMVFEVA
jgi:hypothetical protein